ncbi:major facilitator superfamily domain-containing protein [Astrocystis sublimbata]|nr:major facilitator superfamily domain-containing protein [Astrocystis sublimbata]
MFNKDSWVFPRPPLEPSPDDMHDVCLNDELPDSRSTRSPGGRPECLKNLAHECLFVALIALAAATPVFLQRSIVVVTSSIAVSLDMSPAELAWSTASSGLTTGAFLLPFGYIADTCRVLPRKTLLVASLAAFSLLAVCTSFSQTGIVLDVVSGLTGIACAANVPIALGILSLIYPEDSRRRNMVFSSFFMGTPAATIIGGLGSGGLALRMSWRASFIALGCLFAVIAVLAWVFVPTVPEPEINLQKSELHKTTVRDEPSIIMLGAPKVMTTIMQFDWPGLSLLITGVLLFTVSLTIGPEGPEPWKTPTVILLLTLGLLFLSCFVVWQNVSKRPMIPPSLWAHWSVTLVVICTLGASMAFYSQLFWVSMFMQQLEHLNSFEVAVRLLPQALVGLLASPLVGLFMHAVPGTGLLAFAASALFLSNIFLVFLRHDGHYLLWIFPSLMLSTVGMDWIMNVGSLHILSSLPREHHSVGASLLQTTSRLGVPLGLAVTTSIWSSFDGKADWSQPELAYTHTFIATTAFASLPLLLVPFIRIGKQGHTMGVNPDPEKESSEKGPPGEMKRRTLLLSTPSFSPTETDKSCIKDDEHRPSKRWSLVGSSVPSTAGRSTRAPSISSQSSMGMDTSRTESIARTAIRQGRCSSEKVVWIVCEECGTSKRQRESSAHTLLGDPARYFNDVMHGPDHNVSARDAAHHRPQHLPHHHPLNQQHPQRIRRSPPRLGSPTRNSTTQVPFPARRRLPLVNRQIMTHQMLTHGFQP